MEMVSECKTEGGPDGDESELDDGECDGHGELSEDGLAGVG
jgi:hypothetical protein